MILIANSYWALGSPFSYLSLSKFAKIELPNKINGFKNSALIIWMEPHK